MFTLGYGLWKHVFRKDDYFVCIVGLDNAGKTTFLEQTKTKFGQDYVMMNPAKITSTVGLNIGKIEVGGARLNFWDLGGQEELHPLWDKYFADSHALVYVVDSSDRARFAHSQSAFRQMLANDLVREMPVLVVCNKMDLEDCAGLAEMRTLFVVDDHDGALAVLPVSALEGLNVDRAIHWLLRCLRHSPPSIRP